MAITLDGTTGITTPAETNSGNLYVTGNVGIGTITPVNKLQVDSTSATSTTFSRSGGTNANTNVQFKNSSTSFYLGTNASGNFAIKYNDADLSTSPNLVVDSAGLLQFNSGYGSAATAYGCRAWVNFNGTGTVAIRASGNVSSITDNGTGTYTINFTTAMPDANYAVSGTSMNAVGIDYGGLIAIADNLIFNNNFRIFTSRVSTTLFDPTNVCVSVFR